MKIVTHNAKFHTDDVFAVATLRILLGKENCQVIRTRDESVISSADFVVDVGMVYDEERNRFDHHQPEGAGARENGVPYASFGLVWKKFGKEVCGGESVSTYLDTSLVQAIDALDNGMSISHALVEGVRSFDINSVVNQYRLTWKEEGDWDERFLECVAWVQTLLEREIKMAQDFEEAKAIVIKAYEDASDKKLILIDEKYDLGREIVSNVLSRFPEPLYALLFRKDVGNWQIVTIMKDKVFESRKSLPEAWAGKINQELEEATGVKGTILCHRAGFMCVVDSKEGVLSLAEKALNT